MDTPSTPDMAEKLRAQIVRMVQGNGLPPEAVALTGQHTTHIKLHGRLDLRLTSKTETVQGKGPAPQKFQEQFQTVADITPVIIPRQQQLDTDPQRLQIAANEILAGNHQGWGLMAADIPMPKLVHTIGAQFICSGCEGTQQQTCATCNGARRQTCSHCHGKREITCPTCSGRGVMSSGENCNACRARGLVACATCQGNGETGCTACAGKGQVPCRNCDAKGTLYHQITFNSFAQAQFKMMLAEDYPEDIMRHLRRLKPESLLDGRAVITQEKIETGANEITIHYAAEFLITQYQFQIGDMPVELVTLGNKGTLFDVPPFMDKILAPSLDLMRRAARRELPAAQALQELGRMRFYRVAFTPGPNGRHLKRYCPFGISNSLLREVPKALHYLLSILTEQPRMLAAVAFNAVAAIILLYTYVLDAENRPFAVTDILLWIILLALNAAVILGVHYLVSARTLKTFSIKQNIQLDIDHMVTALGKTGMISLGVTLTLCLLMRLFG